MPPDDITRALVLSLSVCYHARLQEREEFEDEVTKSFTGLINLPGGVQQFRDEIRWYVVVFFLFFFVYLFFGFV